MTVALRNSIPPISEDFDLDGTTIRFDSTIAVFEPADIECTVTSQDNPIRTLVLTQNIPTGNEFAVRDLIPGISFTVVLGAPRTSGETLTVRNVIKFEQPFQFSESRAYRGQPIENALDRLAILAQKSESQGAFAELEDDSVFPRNLAADTPEEKAAFRERIGATSQPGVPGGYGILPVEASASGVVI